MIEGPRRTKRAGARAHEKKMRNKMKKKKKTEKRSNKLSNGQREASGTRRGAIVLHEKLVSSFGLSPVLRALLESLVFLPSFILSPSSSLAIPSFSLRVPVGLSLPAPLLLHLLPHLLFLPLHLRRGGSRTVLSLWLPPGFAFTMFIPNRDK